MPPAELLLDTHTSKPCFCLRMCGSTARLTRCAEHVDIVLLGELLRRERFRRAEHHVTGVMNQHVNAARSLR